MGILLCVMLLATPIRDSVDRVVGRVDGFEQEGILKPKKEKFFGATNLLMGAGIFGSAVADIETTLTCLGTTGQTITPMPNGGTRIETRLCVETNKRMRPFVEAGRWEAYAVKSIVIVPVWVGSHFMRRSPHKPVRIAGWLLPLAGIAFQSKLAFENVRETRFVKTGVR